MIQPFDAAAIKMLKDARIDRPTVAQVTALANDIQGISNDELDGDDYTNCVPDAELAEQAVSILRERIGGLTNLMGYVNCLTAKKLAS